MLRPLPLLFVAACIGNGPGFHCSDDASCGAGGRCEAVGWCSFADPSCVESGRRFGELSGGGLGGSCVAATVVRDGPLALPDATAPDAPAASPDAGCVTQLAAAGRHTCALVGAGAVRCFGDNAGGDLGDGTTVPRPIATTVAGLPEAVARV